LEGRGEAVAIPTREPERATWSERPWAPSCMGGARRLSGGEYLGPELRGEA
jgi:hypothetical protein